MSTPGCIPCMKKIPGVHAVECKRRQQEWERKNEESQYHQTVKQTAKQDAEDLRSDSISLIAAQGPLWYDTATREELNTEKVKLGMQRERKDFIAIPTSVAIRILLAWALRCGCLDRSSTEAGTLWTS